MPIDFDFSREEMYILISLVAEMDPGKRRYQDEIDLIRRCVKEIDRR